MNNHIKIIMIQGVFLALLAVVLLVLYPRANIDLNGNLVNFNSINANVIIISENPDFSNPRYIDFSEKDSFSYNLEPGTYYWKSDNGLIEGIKHEFVVDSEVGMIINKSENESNLENVGNVKINVTRNEKGVMVGHIILEPEESEVINDTGTYTAEQE